MHIEQDRPGQNDRERPDAKQEVAEQEASAPATALQDASQQDSAAEDATEPDAGPDATAELAAEDALPEGATSSPATSSPATLGDVLVALEELWPDSLAEDWDRVGLVAGRLDAPVRRILFAVDPTMDVINDAVERDVDLLITHHPLLLKGVNSVAATSAKGLAVHTLIENGIALVTIHTNGDSAVGGVSDVLADALGLENVAALAPAPNGLPEEGIGRVGQLPQLLPLSELAARLAGFLPLVAGGVRVAGDPQALVRRVAVCGGAGDSLFDAVRASEADVYITADLRHHPASEARETAQGGRPYLIDVSHFASEWLWLPAASQALGNVLQDLGHQVDIDVSVINTDPWDFIITPHGD